MERMSGDRGGFRICQQTEDVARFARGVYLDAVGLDIIVKSSRQLVCGKYGFQFAIADKKDDGLKTGFREVEKIFKRLCVPVILVKRILELEFLPRDGLRPFLGAFATEDPTAHFFRLNHENLENRNENMVNLRCPAMGRENQVVDSPIDFAIEPQLHPEQSLFSSNPAYYEREHDRYFLDAFRGLLWHFFGLSSSPSTSDSSIIMKDSCLIGVGCEGKRVAFLRRTPPTAPAIVLATVGPCRTAAATALSVSGRMMCV